MEEYQGDGNDIVNGNGDGTAANARQESAITRIVLLQDMALMEKGRVRVLRETLPSGVRKSVTSCRSSTVSRVHCRPGIVREDDEELSVQCSGKAMWARSCNAVMVHPVPSISRQNFAMKMLLSLANFPRLSHHWTPKEQNCHRGPSSTFDGA